MQDTCALSTGSRLTLAGLAVLGLASPAHAAGTTLNFDNFTAGAQAAGGSVFVGPTYDSQGFTLASGAFNGFYATSGSDPTYGDGQTSLYSNRAASTTLTQDNGQAFSFNAIDLGPFLGNSTPRFDGLVTFTGTQAGGGTVTATKTMTSAAFQTFTFKGFTSLTSLTFGGDYTVATDKGSAPQFDNVVLNAAPVPEASSTVSLGLMLALGLAGVVVMRRKA